MAGLLPTAPASARTVGSACPVRSVPSRIAASALAASSRAVEPVIRAGFVAAALTAAVAGVGSRRGGRTRPLLVLFYLKHAFVL